ncbi:NmrA-like family protein [Catalinimonas alkaloidigena]|uniref:NmrA-like family protein n=1 Tax=Catalinimonas alkaloidigena TaxID=1075417 RepID=A0A1G8X2B2_9BACT|nr:NmrA family NAD(P)-binding protein [Catalinimonas alkaloidigena]SDJ83890.1 NmrA-like family protein [Catalinimonas alkaloidigena]
MDKTILVAGGTGDLGGQIIARLLDRGARVRALVRASSDAVTVHNLEQRGAHIITLDLADQAALTHACEGVDCVVSALSGLGEVIFTAQKQLLDAAVRAGVPRFIPSDFAADFTKLPAGTNRNFDLRRAFRTYLEAQPIAATSVLNGMFMDLLTGQAPMILFPLKRVMYWERADQLLDFTTIANTAEYTAAAALDPDTPRFLRIAGDVLDARGLAVVASEVTGDQFRVVRAGSLKRLGTLINVTRMVAPAADEVFPAWQGMQYTRDMFDGRGKLAPLDNDRYPGIRWTKVKDLLTAHQSVVTA